jgi:hypothetical protein
MNKEKTIQQMDDEDTELTENMEPCSQEFEEPEAQESDEPCSAVALRAPLVTLHEPDAQLVAYQVAGSLSVSRYLDNERERQMMECSLALYAAIDPKDALESILARLAVAVTNASMDSFTRAALSGCWPEARDLNLRYGIKGAAAAAELVKALDQHRGRDRQSVTVGQVNVQKGGQAIVGNVERRHPEEARADNAPLAITARQPDEHQDE